MAPSLKRLYLVSEAGPPQGLKPASSARKQVAQGTVKPGEPGWGQQRPPEENDPTKDLAAEKAALEGHVKQYLGSDQDPGKSLMPVAGELADIIAKSADPNFVSKIEGSFKDMLSKARLVRQGQARTGESLVWGDLLEMVQLSEDSKAIELVINRYAKRLVGVKDVDTASKILRNAIAAATGKASQSTASSEPGTSGTASTASTSGGTPDVAQQKQAQPTAGTPTISKVGRGGDSRKIMAALMKPLPSVKKMEVTQPLATGLIRAANKLSVHLALSPASTPDKVKVFVKAWNTFVSDIASFIPRKA